MLLFICKLFPPIYVPLSSISTTLNIYQGDPSATLAFSWIDTPGVLIMICGIIGVVIQGCSVREMLGVLKDACVQTTKTVLTVLGVLAVAKIMGYSDMISSIAAFFVAVGGGFYPLVAPLVGALGTFVVESGTSSEVLFGNV
ncbi:L-lactate permease [Paratractidigestivibacter sp.]|uniref:L-lactate permease n=1 Tax=Paratractidigestivibacter sp. TaxID=2847316 RepID=UPI002AC8AE3B|nr:L-lactate permease [Paratractidigestivibacter sp.]